MSSSSSFTNPQKFTSTSIRFEKAASFQSSDNTNFIIAPRAHHTSTIVGSFMYIIGGTMGKSFFSDVRVIDLRGRDRDWSIPTLVTSMGTGDFQDVPMRGEITKPFEGRSRHTAVTVKNQKGNHVNISGERLGARRWGTSLYHCCFLCVVPLKPFTLTIVRV